MVSSKQEAPEKGGWFFSFTAPRGAAPDPH